MIFIQPKIHFFVSFCLILLTLTFEQIKCELPSDSSLLKYSLVDGLPDIYICPESEKIGHTWSCGTVWDRNIIQKFYSLLSKNDFFVAIDLGAQTGCFSLLAKYLPNSMWYAFEPIEEAANILKKNLAINDIHNVYVQQMAAAHYSGMAILTMPSQNAWGLSTLGTKDYRFTPQIQREVECVRLDDFVAAYHIKKVHFMKLDTEGYELFILRGGKNMLMRDHPIMIMEYNESNMKQCGVSKEEIHQCLTELGYQWIQIGGDDILCVPTQSLVEIQ